MRATSAKISTLVVAAQAGDRRALDELVALHLPLLYTLVRRALSEQVDVDDVVQETMLRALRELGELRSPESFRRWLATIAVRQVSTHIHRRDTAQARTAPLDELISTPDAGFEDATFAHMQLSDQRRQVVRASRWLDPDDRTLLSLWWLEVAGELTRHDVAAAIGVTAVHAGMRVQRMRNQLEVSRTLVAALDAKPRCAQLDAATVGWKGRPSPLWRKRLARHTRSCVMCSRAAGAMVPTDRLLVGVALLPVPMAMAAGLVGKSAFAASAAGATATAAGKAGFLGPLVQAIAVHPVAATVMAGTIIAGTTMATVLPRAEPPRSPTVAASVPVARPVGSPNPPTPAVSPPPVTAAQTLSPGPASLESANQVGFFVTTVNDLGVVAAVGPNAAVPDRERATFEVIPGLANASCFSFRTRDGRYLRHSSWRVQLSRNEGTPLFRGDATFCVKPGPVSDSVSLESANYPGWFMRHRGDEVWVDQANPTPAFRIETGFRVRPPRLT